MIDSLLTEYTEDVNFWKVYPAFLKPKIYKDFYDADKTRGKKYSSKIMWAMNFILDRSKFNPYSKLNSNDRIDSVNKEVLEDPDFNWEMYSDLLEYTRNVLMTEIEKNYWGVVQILEDKRIMLEKTPMTLANVDKIDKAIVGNSKLRLEIEEWRKLLEQEQGDGQTKGGIQESASERGWL